MKNIFLIICLITFFGLTLNKSHPDKISIKCLFQIYREYRDVKLITSDTWDYEKFELDTLDLFSRFDDEQVAHQVESMAGFLYDKYSHFLNPPIESKVNEIFMRNIECFRQVGLIQ